MIRSVLLITLLFLTTACGHSVLGYDIRPTPIGMHDAPENAPPNYKQGWADGCESGYSAFGNSFYKTVYRLKKDRSLVNDRIYLRAWTDAFDYCRSKVNRELMEGLFWGPAFGGGQEGVFPRLGNKQASYSAPGNVFDQLLPLDGAGGPFTPDRDLRSPSTINQRGFALPLQGGVQFPGE